MRARARVCVRVKSVDVRQKLARHLEQSRLRMWRWTQAQVRERIAPRICQLGNGPAGPFTVWNVANEEALLRRWFDHMREVKPAIYVTYNGDWFDWPFIETRAAKLGMDMLDEIGFQMNSKQHECLSR